MALYSPGTPFDKEVMEAETMEGDRMRVLCSNMPSVKLCLVPAFVRLFRGESEVGSEMNVLV
jgi:hypothetical protein